MTRELEFVRGNQKSCIRIPCEEAVLSGYEYQMCMYNHLGTIVSFQHKNINGRQYLYFDISGMQSLDIFLQTQKLKRPMLLILARSMIKLCKELSEYALSIEGIVFEPKYVMLGHAQTQICFLYDFEKKDDNYAGMEALLECCIEHLDYKDDVLMERLYQIYERLLAQKQNFSIQAEMEELEKALSDASDKQEADVDMQAVSLEDTGFEQKEGKKEVSSVEEEADREQAGCVSETVQNIQQPSDIVKMDRKQLKRGLWLLVFVDIAVVVLWRPLTILKIAFCSSLGVVFVGLWSYMDKKEEAERQQCEKIKQQAAHMEEYVELQKEYEHLSDGTQIISVEDIGGVLYNLQNSEPQYIHIGEKEKVIGKDAQHVQVCMQQEGISRIHARVVKKDGHCIIEDLNSTNGTWVNGKVLQPRKAYILKEGDKVRFAGLEYIFR